MSNAEQPQVNKPQRALWRNKDYLLLASGQAISVSGTQISDLAYILLILAFTHSPAQVGFVGAVRVLPSLILSLPAGALVDRWERKRLMLVCDTGRAVCLASIPVAFALGHLGIVQLYFTALIEATLATFFDVAQTAALPRVVSPQQLPAVMSQNQTIAHTSALVSPTLSGVLFTIGQAFPFLVDAVSYMASVFSLLFITTPFQGRRNARSRSLLAEIKEGLLWVWHHRILRAMMVLVASLNLTVAGINLVIVVLAQQLHASSPVIGLIFASGSIGGIAGAMIAPAVQKRFTYGQAMMGICWLTALLWLLFALASQVIILGGLFALFLIWGRIMTVVNFTYRTALTPDEMRGRVYGVGNLLVRSCPPLGLAATGLLLQFLGATATILLIGGCRLLIAIVVTLSAAIRSVRPLNELPATAKA